MIDEKQHPAAAEEEGEEGISPEFGAERGVRHIQVDARPAGVRTCRRTFRRRRIGGLGHRHARQLWHRFGVMVWRVIRRQRRHASAFHDSLDRHLHRRRDRRLDHQVAKLGEMAHRLERPRLDPGDANLLGIPEVALLQRAANARSRPFDRVDDPIVVGVDQIPEIGRPFHARLGARQLLRAVPRQILNELPAALGPMHRLGAERPPDRPIDALGNLRIQLARRVNLVVVLLHPRIERARRFEGQFTRHHHVQRGSQRINVATGVGVLGVAKLFRGHEMGRAQAAAGARQVVVGLQFLDEAQIGQFHLAVGRQQHVVRLHVAVDQAFLVGFLQSLADLGDDANRFFLVLAAIALDFLAQRLALDELHDQVMRCAFLSEVQCFDDVRMIDLLGDVVFELKAFENDRVGEQMLRHHLDGDNIAAGAVPAAVNSAHAPLGNLFYKIVIANGLHVSVQIIYRHRRCPLLACRG